jgi:hypothetical protein
MVDALTRREILEIGSGLLASATSIIGKEARGCAILTMDGFGSRSNS